MTDTPAARAALASLAALNSRDLERIRDLVTADFVDHGLPPGVVPAGPDGYIATLGWVTGTLGITYEVHRLVADGDFVAVHATAHGVHASDHLGVPATGREFHMPTMHLYRAEGGRLAEHWGIRDEWSVLVQVGALAPRMPDLRPAGAAHS